MWSFVIPGPPACKQRPRRDPRSGRWYTPTQTRDAEAAVSLWALSTRPLDWPLDGRYWLRVRVVWPDRRRRDLDNVAKLIADALNGVAWTDDSRIVVWELSADVDAVNPRVEIRIEEHHGDDARV